MPIFYMTYSSPLVSVIIPAFNSADYIEEAIESVLSQTFQDFEIVIVDDGSTDTTSDILSRYADCTRLVSQKNRGVAAARNAGVENARGKFISFLDADDTFFPEKLAKQVELFEQSPSLGMVICGWQLVTTSGESISLAKPWEYRPLLDLETAVLFKPARPSATMLRKKWFERVGGFNTELSSAEDLDLLLRLMIAGCKAAWLPAVMARYRQSASSLMKQGEALLQNTEQVMTHFFERANLPVEIQRLQWQERYQSWNWLAAKMYFEKQLTLMGRCLKRSLQYVGQERPAAVFDWFRAFESYADEYGYRLNSYAVTSCREWQEAVRLALLPGEVVIEAIQQPSAEEACCVKATDGGRKKHVLLYSDDPGAGGILQCNHAIVCRLAEAGYATSHVHFYQQTPLGDREAELGIASINLGYNADSDFTRSLKDLAGAKKLFTAHRPDLIVFSDGWPFSNVAAKQAACELGIPYVIVLGFIEPSCVRYDYQDGVDYRDLAALQYVRAGSVVAVSQENLTLLRGLFELPDSVGEVIYNGRPAAYFESQDKETRRRLREEVNIPDDAVVCFTSGRFETVKGYQYQVEAMRKLKTLSVWEKLYFVWAGAGEGFLSKSNECELKEAVEALGVADRVKFLGLRWDVADWLDASDIFVLPSEAEGMPLSVMEAMAKGLPVVATAVSGVPEELGDTGKLLTDPTKNAKATVNELVRTIEAWSMSEELRQRIAKRCRERAVDLFQQETMLRKYEANIRTCFAREQKRNLERLTPEVTRNLERQFRYGCWVWKSWDCYQRADFEAMETALEQAVFLMSGDTAWPVLDWGKWFAHFSKEQCVGFDTALLVRSGIYQQLIMTAGR